MSEFIARLRRHPTPWMFGGWILLGAYYTARNVVSAVARDRPVDWTRDVLNELIYWCAWGAMMPLIVWFARRMRARLHPARAALAIAAFGLIVTPLQGVLEAGVAIGMNRFIAGDSADAIAARLPLIARAVALGCFTGYVTYWIIVGGDFALAYYDAFRDREVAAAELQRRLAETRLQNLRAQLQPHFLFNTLHTAGVLMKRDVQGAQQILVRLSSLLRTTLQVSGAQEVTLRDEIDCAQQYLAIEQVRFSDRLRVTIDADPSVLEALVPTMILQPIVENAIHHGIAVKAAAGVVSIRAQCTANRLEIQIRDDGPGFPVAAPSTEGVGLSNTRARLSLLYADGQSLTVSNATGGGAIVTIIVPYRRAA